MVVAPLVLFPLLLLSGLAYLSRGSARRGLGLTAAALGIGYLAGWLLEAQYATGLFVAGQTTPILLWRLVFTLVVVGLVAWPAWMVRSWLKAPPTRTFKGMVVGLHLVLLAGASWYLVALAGVWGLLNPFR